MYSPSIAEYKNKDITNVHLTAEETPLDPLMNDIQKKRISIPSTAGRRPVYVSAVISYFLAYDAANVLNNYNLATTSSKIHICITWIGTARQLLIEFTFLAEKWGITCERAQKTIQDPLQRGFCILLNLF